MVDLILIGSWSFRKKCSKYFGNMRLDIDFQTQKNQQMQSKHTEYVKQKNHKKEKKRKSKVDAVRFDNINKLSHKNMCLIFTNVVIGAIASPMWSYSYSFDFGSLNGNRFMENR